MKARGLVLVTFAMTVVMTLAAAAATKDQPSKRDIEEHACYNDAMSLCKEFVPDEAKITTCMEQKKAQLSAPCAALFEK